MNKCCTITLRHRYEGEQWLPREHIQTREHREHADSGQDTPCAPAKGLPPAFCTRSPHAPHDMHALRGMQRDAEHERSVQRPATHGPRGKAGLNELVVELGGAQGGDGRRDVRREQPVRRDVHRQQEQQYSVPRDRERAGKRAWRARSEQTFEERGACVDEEGRVDEHGFRRGGLVVLTAKQLCVQESMSRQGGE